MRKKLQESRERSYLIAKIRTDVDYYYQKNIQRFVRINEIKITDIVEDTKLSKQTVSNYCRGKHPSVEFFLYLNRKYGLPIEDLITRTMTENELDLKIGKDLIQKSSKQGFTDRIKGYLGVYVTYEIDDTPFKGSVPTDEDNALQYGILLVYRPEGVTTEWECRCLYLPGLTDKKDCSLLFNKLLSLYAEEEYEEIENRLQLKNGNRLMSGTFKIMEKEGYIYLTRRNAQALMIFKTVQPEINKYIGGVATMNTISGGGDPAPTLKLVGISRGLMERTDREIYRHLLFSPDFRAGETAEDFWELVKMYYLESDVAKKLNDEQRKVIIQANIELAIRKEVEANSFRFFKLIALDDNRFYQFLMENMETDTDDR